MSDHIGPLWAIYTVLRPWSLNGFRSSTMAVTRIVAHQLTAAQAPRLPGTSAAPLASSRSSEITDDARYPSLWATAPQQCFLASVFSSLIKQHLGLRQADVLRNRTKIRPRLALVLGHILEEQYLALNVDLHQIRLPVGLAHLLAPRISKVPPFPTWPRMP